MKKYRLIIACQLMVLAFLLFNLWNKNRESILYARIEPDVKEQAESILSVLGISASNAINMFYKQIILNRGLPFEVKIPTARSADVSKLSEAELNAELEKGYADMAAGKTKPARQAFADIRKDYGI